jgi:hypothetical protein
MKLHIQPLERKCDFLDELGRESIRLFKFENYIAGKVLPMPQDYLMDLPPNILEPAVDKVVRLDNYLTHLNLIWILKESLTVFKEKNYLALYIVPYVLLRKNNDITAGMACTKAAIITTYFAEKYFKEEKNSTSIRLGLHELGHLLGLKNHSDNGENCVMISEFIELSKYRTSPPNLCEVCKKGIGYTNDNLSQSS